MPPRLLRGLLASRAWSPRPSAISEYSLRTPPEGISPCKQYKAGGVEQGRRSTATVVTVCPRTNIHGHGRLPYCWLYYARNASQRTDGGTFPSPDVGQPYKRPPLHKRGSSWTETPKALVQAPHKAGTQSGEAMARSMERDMPLSKWFESCLGASRTKDRTTTHTATWAMAELLDRVMLLSPQSRTAPTCVSG